MGIFTGFEEIVRSDEPMAMHTWFQLGRTGRIFRRADATWTNWWPWCSRGAEQRGCPCAILGRGSNILVRDEGVSGIDNLSFRASVPRD